MSYSYNDYRYLLSTDPAQAVSSWEQEHGDLASASFPGPSNDASNWWQSSSIWTPSHPEGQDISLSQELNRTDHTDQGHVPGESSLGVSFLTSAAATHHSSQGPRGVSKSRPKRKMINLAPAPPRAGTKRFISPTDERIGIPRLRKRVLFMQPTTQHTFQEDTSSRHMLLTEANVAVHAQRVQLA